MQSEVLKRTQQSTVQRVPEPELDRNVVVEVMQDVPGIRPFRRRSQSEEYSRLATSHILGFIRRRKQMRQQLRIGWRCRVVELIYDHDIKGRWLQRFEICLCQ